MGILPESRKGNLGFKSGWWKLGVGFVLLLRYLCGAVTK